ncbi:TetR/AcrR family transcriptional regulator [Gryllotalpicola protaetiae]|uniref:TetR/AcrR family transcriptional regulator n=1 Tax=Gryllotalpicola protaetiae TaxID=2419771 RepID=UPI0013C43B1A|nr:TetR family transcriptional regulator C-terminal domain-containing protein [Gryllotalpicola protaetiae]
MSSQAVRRQAPSPEDLTPKGRATRTRIVELAASYVHAHGIASSTIEELRAAANASPSQLTHYFGDRRELVTAVINELIESTIDAQEPLLSNLTSFDAFEHWCEYQVGVQLRNACVGGCPVGSLVGQVAEVDDEWRQLVGEGFERWREPIVVGIRVMQERGLISRTAGAEKLATSALAALEGGAVLSQATRSVTPLADALEMFMALLRSYATSGAVS